MSILPTYAKTWDFTGINTRITYASLNDTMATLIYGIKNYLKTTMGSTVVYTCDGTTGPTSGVDHTDRWASKANATTRGATTATANSFWVGTWGTGQVMISYVGASDDIARISYSPGSLFTPAGTANQTPTATDECIIVAAVSIIAATTSLDRVYSIQATTDMSIFRVFIFRASAMTQSFGLELFTPGPNIPSNLMIGWNSNNSTQTGITGNGSHAGAQAGSITGGANEFKVYLNGAARNCTGGTILWGGSGAASSPFATVPELNQGVCIWPILIGSTVALNTGWVGVRIDAWWSSTLAPILGMITDDTAAGTRIIYAGQMQTPWSTVAGLVTT